MADRQLAYRPSEKQSQLLSGASEIRDNIFSHLLPTSFEIKYHPKGTNARSISAEHSLLLVNKQISKEYLDVICRRASHTITIDRERGKQKGFAVAVSPYMRTKIRHLRVSCEHSTGSSNEAAGVIGLSSDIGRPQELLKPYALGDKTVILHHLSKSLSSFTGLQKATSIWEGIDWHPEHEVEVSMSPMKPLSRCHIA